MSKPLLPRLHLFEFLDQPWLPGILRRYLTDYLAFIQHRFGFDQLMAERLLEELQQMERDDDEPWRVVDLGSGSGGPILGLVDRLELLGHRLDVVLTDLHPDKATADRFEDNPAVRYRRQPVDATDVPAELTGMRTMVNLLHHLRPEQVRGLLADAARKGQPLATFDVVERKLQSVFVVIFIPIFVLVMTPLIRPFRWSRLLLTYLIPLVTLQTTWDGLVSQLRAYAPSELEELASGLGDGGYTFDTGILERGPMRVTYLVGRPAAKG